MKKRLRKKKHYGEFAEFGAKIGLRFNDELTELEFDEFFDQWIETVESIDTYCSGGGSHSEKKISFFVELGDLETAKSRLDLLVKWVNQYPKIIQVETGNIIDAWYSPANAI